MKKDFTEKQKEILLAQRQEIINSLTGQSEQLSKLTASEESGDDVDIASDVIDRTLLNSLGEADSRRLASIDAALERIRRGTYGNCVLCQKPIPEGRLEAIPYAALCIGCQTKQERSKRQG